MDRENLTLPGSANLVLLLPTGYRAGLLCELPDSHPGPFCLSSSVADPHLLLCGSRIQKMSIWIRIIGGKD